MSLAASPITNLYQSTRVKFGEQIQNVALASLPIDIVLRDHVVDDFGYLNRMRDHVPYAQPDRIEAVIRTTRQIQDRGFALEFAGHLVGRNRDN